MTRTKTNHAYKGPSGIRAHYKKTKVHSKEKVANMMNDLPITGPRRKKQRQGLWWALWQMDISYLYSRSGCTIEPYYVVELAEEDFEACYRLVELTSKATYQLSRGGWNGKEKMREMKQDFMCYLLVRAERGFSRPNTPTEERSSMLTLGDVLGFTSFMISEDEYPNPEGKVIYIYEIHFHKAARRCGLGSYLMGILEQLAMKLGINKLMLTVFKINEGARTLYERLGYRRDAASPMKETRTGIKDTADYLILSKHLDDAWRG
ncbi:acyl-CoA N-acyltransferase [Massariosphaeria phaeospora]|uniref:N-alpha-acetyltransferase 40 n=1 Tax=Massariosphaeria phaeospora TaxID=100035 RepID=A0A7C8ICE3_9PLEO|nr:acyl-CoA N-acyltransferase [Massariosphaeria phaeospora]